ncbi:MAG: GGDEF domain-containing protein [Hyphomicrobiales bacterium]|nr:MAG: GGDEF domain-containing protein [Hyphomicrobiales bacterium]
MAGSVRRRGAIVAAKRPTSNGLHPRLRAAEKRLIERYDHVTAIPNRLLFLSDFKRLRGRSGKGRLLALLTLCDARHYNEILRALGHAFSEEFVRAGLERLREMLPPEIAVYHVSVLSFAFVIEHEGTDVPELAREIADGFAHDLVVDDIPVRTKVGLGLMPLQAAAMDPAEVLRAVLVAAQDSRRSDAGIAFYNNRSDAAHRRAFTLLADLPKALKAKERQLSLAFQPRVDMATGACHGAEALLRWRHPTLGNVPPAEFIPLAEQTALIHPLTDWVLDHALAAAARLRDAGHRLKISVNASPLNLSEPGFDDKLFWALDKHGLETSALEIEFTEGTMAANQERATRQLERIRKAGIRVAIDDFGTGFSNLSYLRAIPADVLKIDQSFIRPLTVADSFMVQQILAMAHGLGLDVCAEGIETAEAFGLLRSLGCDEGQGYHIGRPMPEADLLHWLGGEYALAM